jgi:chorismate mutase
VAVALGLITAAPGHADDTPSDTSALDTLVDVAAQRLQAADPVAANKWLNGGSITDPVRVHQVLADVIGAARTVGAPADFVTEVFTDQIDATEAIQYERFSRWKLDPASAPTSAPDLSASRSVIDGLNRRMVSEITEAWPLLTGPGCESGLLSARDGAAQRHALDPLYREALDAATRSYCH